MSTKNVNKGVNMDRDGRNLYNAIRTLNWSSRL